jgi:hypothetical protein
LISRRLRTAPAAAVAFDFGDDVSAFRFVVGVFRRSAERVRHGRIGNAVADMRVVERIFLHTARLLRGRRPAVRILSVRFQNIVERVFHRRQISFVIDGRVFVFIFRAVSVSYGF